MTPNDDTRGEELLARYRRASDLHAAAPSDAVRAAILAEGRRVADELAKNAPQHTFDASRPAANDSRWKITAFGTVGAALLAALLFAPRYWENAPPAQMAMAPAPQSATETASAPGSAAPSAAAPKLEEVKPYVAPSTSAPQPPSDAASVQEIVVTQANRKSTRSNAAPSLNPAVPAPPAAAPPSAAARLRQQDLSGGAAESDAQSVLGGFAARDSALKPATLESAVARGDVAQTALLLDQGAVIDARDGAGRTPLMLAVIQSRLEIVRLLLARGADPNAADNNGHTPLQQARERNLRDVAASLTLAGAH
jgi:hypothetical protein